MLLESTLDLIGNTPLYHFKGESIYAKAEFLNPSGSIKDRIALAIIEHAENDKLLHSNSIIVEATSGNTGIAMALVGTLKGYPVQIVMPEDMSEERKKLIKLLGASLVLTPKEDGIAGAVHTAQEMANKNHNIFFPKQFENLDNPRVHYEKTATELWKQMKGDISFVIAGIGSGGTLQGIGKYVKEYQPNAKVIAVEPKNVSALLGHEPGLHQIQGIGDGFIPEVLDVSLIDDIIEITDEDAIKTTRELNKKYGLLVGISSGANVWAARQLAKENKGNIATVLPDRAERYFSTALF